MAEGLSQVLKYQEMYKNCVTGCYGSPRSPPRPQLIDQTNSSNTGMTALALGSSQDVSPPRRARRSLTMQRTPFGSCLRKCSPQKMLILADKQIFKRPISSAFTNQVA